MNPRRGVLMHALATVVACALTTAAAIAQPAPPAGHQIVTGTIWRIDSQAGAFDLLTGVGHVIRVTRIRYAVGLKVMSGRKEAGMSALVPGTVCRVECEAGTSGATATGVEVLQPERAK